MRTCVPSVELSSIRTDAPITMATLPQATAQEVFDQVAAHLLAQGRKSHMPNSTTACAYRGSEGAKCAAGCLIGDDEYRPEFERHTWGELCDDFDGPKQHRELVRYLQMVHDRALPSEWRDRLRGCAQSYGLRFEEGA